MTARSGMVAAEHHTGAAGDGVGARYVFIVNPAAGGGLAGRNWPRLARRLDASGLDYHASFSEGPGHAHVLAQDALGAGRHHLVAVGGDGTANEVLNGLFNAPLAQREGAVLGIVPWGTGNDWASYYRMPAEPDAYIALLRRGRILSQDIGRAVFGGLGAAGGERYFLNCAGTGFDSFLLRHMGSTRGSRLRYPVSVVRYLRAFRGSSLSLRLDNAASEHSALMLAVCLGASFGAGMRVAPGAIADDGRFDVLLIGQMSLPRLLVSLPYLYNGHIREHPLVRSWRARTIDIDAGEPQFLQCDGELAGPLPVRIELLAGALRVAAPAPAAEASR